MAAPMATISTCSATLPAFGGSPARGLVRQLLSHGAANPLRRGSFVSATTGHGQSLPCHPQPVTRQPRDGPGVVDRRPYVDLDLAQGDRRLEGLGSVTLPNDALDRLVRRCRTMVARSHNTGPAQQSSKSIQTTPLAVTRELRANASPCWAWRSGASSRSRAMSTSRRPRTSSAWPALMTSRPDEERERPLEVVGDRVEERQVARVVAHGRVELVEGDEGRG